MTYRADSEVTDGCIALPLPFAAGALALPLPLPFTLAAEISSAVALTRGTAFAGLGMSKFALFGTLLTKGLIKRERNLQWIKYTVVSSLRTCLNVVRSDLRLKIGT